MQYSRTYGGTFLRDLDLYVKPLALKKVAQDVSHGACMGVVLDNCTVLPRNR